MDSSSSSCQYPITCPFCRIGAAYQHNDDPIPSNPDPTLVDPNCFLVLSTPYILAFLDILPMCPGHLLVTTRHHHEKLSDVPLEPTAQALGFWMPLISRALAKTLNIEDWNVVQNNGARAAQVVPHVHFHFIPRYPEGRKELGRKGAVDAATMRSWRMFGRGLREELDDDEAVEMAAKIREGLAREIDELGRDKVKL